MSFGVVFVPEAESEYYSWGLPLEVYEEIERRLAEELSEHPTRHLRNLPASLQYVIRLKDHPALPGQHLFGFRVHYSADEEDLVIWQCFHLPLHL